jgi:hypothetical protein
MLRILGIGNKKRGYLPITPQKFKQPFLENQAEAEKATPGA